MADKPSVTLSFNPAGPQFSISEQCQMPDITVTATIKGATPDPKVPLSYQWNVALTFDGKGCPNFAGNTTAHSAIPQSTTTTNTFKIPFTEIRGGDLVIGVRVTVGTAVLTAKSENLKVIGTNPATATLSNFVSTFSPPVIFRKLMRLESSLQQFITRSSQVWPLFSQDHLGGVGLCQITPAQTADQVWSWKQNVKDGWALYKQKQTAARNYPAHVRKSPEFQALVKAYNDQRYEKLKKAALTPVPGAPPPPGPPKEVPRQDLTITLPDFTDDQLALDTVRGFNGFAGGLHEYRTRVDINGLLVVTEDVPRNTGAAEWERLTADDRNKVYDKLGIKHRGDPNYVVDVEAKASF